MGFSHKLDEPNHLPFPLVVYLQLVDWSGRAIRSDKKGYIPPDTPPILLRLGMVPDHLLDYRQVRPDTFSCAIGPATRIRLMAHRLGLSFMRGIALAKELCPESA